MRLLLIQVLMGLEHVHACHLTHLDIKPANILLRKALNGRDAASVDAALGHLGLARVGGMELEEPHGSAGFMPPEVVLASPASPVHAHASMDIWSMGILMLELAGWHGLASMTVSEVQAALRDGRLATHLQNGLLACKPEYARLCAACLRRSPQNRPTAAELLQRVKHLRAQIKPRQTACW
jgi:eukaryotic-like serine/threonine-protein kinase